MTADDFTTANFTANLKLAASYHPSVSALCRKLGLNRQQFMKYLSGQAFPSRHNLRRICDFFGLDEYEVLMPHDQFRTIVRLRPNRDADEPNLPPQLLPLLAQAQRDRNALGKLQGYYYEYYLSFSTPGNILRSLVVIYGWKDYTLYKRLERLRRPGRAGPPDVYKYAGVVSIAGDRLHLLDRETITGSEITQTILFMNYRNRVTTLTGLTMGVSGGDAHEPAAARVVMEYVGRSVNLRQAIAECRLYPIGSPEIPPPVRDNLTAGGRLSGPLRAAVL